MGTRLDDGAISARKGAMGGVGLGEPSKRPTRQREPGPCPTKGLCYNLPVPLKLVLMTGFVLMRGCPSKGLADGGRLERALMTGCAALDAVEHEAVQLGYRLPFDYSGLVLNGFK